VCGSAGNNTRSTGRPLGVIGAGLMVPTLSWTLDHGQKSR